MWVPHTTKKVDLNLVILGRTFLWQTPNFHAQNECSFIDSLNSTHIDIEGIHTWQLTEKIW